MVVEVIAEASKEGASRSVKSFESQQLSANSSNSGRGTLANHRVKVETFEVASYAAAAGASRAAEMASAIPEERDLDISANQSYAGKTFQKPDSLV